MATAPPKRRRAPTTPKKTARKVTARPAANKKTAKKTATKKAETKKAAAKKTAKKAAAKKTAKKTAAKKPAKKPAARYPFPFFGAGLARYFEWGSLFVWFETPPPRAARAKLKKAIPEPFRQDVEWGGPVLHPGSGGQFTNLHICSAYARLGDPNDSDQGPDDEDYFDSIEGFGVGEPFPNNKQSRAFEADITRWLHALHRKHPIAFVARREDSEAGGTELDAWHRWSLTRFADVLLPRIEAHLRKPGPKLTDWALHEAIDLVLDSPRADQVPAAVRAWAAREP
jgi:hypothetical protein